MFSLLEVVNVISQVTELLMAMVRKEIRAVLRTLLRVSNYRENSRR